MTNRNTLRAAFVVALLIPELITGLAIAARPARGAIEPPDPTPAIGETVIEELPKRVFLPEVAREP
jgi:hypothetical protein